MGLFNVLRLTCPCHSCGTSRDLDLQFRYAQLRQTEYRVGSMLDWTEPGWEGVPYRGYVLVNAVAGECPECDNDDNYLIVVRAGRIVGVIPYFDVFDDDPDPWEFRYGTGEMDWSAEPNEEEVLARPTPRRIRRSTSHHEPPADPPGE